MEIKDPARLHERFLIFPFYCSDCGKRFMLENGAIEKVSSYEFGDRFIGYKKYYKYCYNCAAKEFAKLYKEESEK